MSNWFTQRVVESPGKANRIEDFLYNMSEYIDMGWLYLKIHRVWLGHDRWPGPLMSLKIFWQRGRHGYADSDLWSVDRYLAKILVGALCDFKKKTDNCPSEVTEEEWDSKLDTMIAGFKAVGALNDMDWWDSNDVEGSRSKENELEATIDAGLNEFSTWFQSLWW